MEALKKAALLIPVIFSALVCAYAIGGTLYKWTDEKGYIHYSDQLPVKLDEPVLSAIDCTFIIKGSRNLGTGFFISPKGYAVTCKHVVEDDQNHMAILPGQGEFAIGVIATSDRYDLALILVTAPENTPYLVFRDVMSMEPGEKVYAIGSSVGLQSTLTYGAFSSLREKLPDKDLVIQFSSPLNTGNSGGPLIDGEGKAIGVVSWQLIADKGVPVSDVGFAVPVGYLVEEYKSYFGDDPYSF
jgi:S1-C subfamily serine protease